MDTDQLEKANKLAAEIVNQKTILEELRAAKESIQMTSEDVESNIKDSYIVVVLNDDKDLEIPVSSLEIPAVIDKEIMVAEKQLKSLELAFEKI